MKKFLLCCLLIMVMATLGCSSNKLDADNPVTITLWHVYGNQVQSPLNEQVKQFNNTEGKKHGVIVHVTSVLDSARMDLALQRAIKKEPGAAVLPDMFIGYPRVFTLFQQGQLLQWDDYLTKEDLSVYHSDFLDEGRRDGHLLLLPIAKSTDMFLVNETLLKRYAVSHQISLHSLQDADRLFEIARSYYVNSGGKHMMEIEDYYHYFLINVASLGDTLVKNDRLDMHSRAFEQIYKVIARTAIAGGLSVMKGYATDRWKTGDAIANIGSSAGVLYHRDYVTYPDNTRENVELGILPYPLFHGGKNLLIQRGGSLAALHSTDERKNQAVAVFGKWIGQKENNLPFVTKAGYLPVHDDAIKELYQNTDMVKEKKFRVIYETLSSYYKDVPYITLPIYPNSVPVQHQFENDIKTVLRGKHEIYRQNVPLGSMNEDLLNQLIQESLDEVRTLLE